MSQREEEWPLTAAETEAEEAAYQAAVAAGTHTAWPWVIDTSHGGARVNSLGMHEAAAWCRRDMARAYMVPAAVVVDAFLDSLPPLKGGAA